MTSSDPDPSFKVTLSFKVDYLANGASDPIRVTPINSAFHLSGVRKSSTSLLAVVKAGRVHLCQVAGNTV